jgi:hypothetical protein
MRGAPGRGRTWLLWAVALAAAVILFFVAVGLWVGRGHRGQRAVLRQVECMSNLSKLTECYARTAGAGRLDPSLHGSAQLLSWFGPNELRLLDERTLVCPGDEAVVVPEDDAARRAFHPDDAAALRAARGLGSYAVRDFERFPVDPASKEKQPILCDRQGADGRTPHHRDCIVVAFADGDVQKMTEEGLGIAPDEPIVVGPDSPTPLLRVFERP